MIAYQPSASPHITLPWYPSTSPITLLLAAAYRWFHKPERNKPDCRSVEENGPEDLQSKATYNPKPSNAGSLESDMGWQYSL